MVRLTHRVTVGRGRDSDVRIRDETVSREHATLQLNGDGSVLVTDLSSANGTFLQVGDDWQRIQSAVADLDDAVRFGASDQVLRELLRRVPGLVLVGEEGETVDAPGEGVIELRTARARAVLERPRRNPETGDIEDQH